MSLLAAAALVLAASAAFVFFRRWRRSAGEVRLWQEWAETLPPEEVLVPLVAEWRQGELMATEARALRAQAEADRAELECLRQHLLARTR